MNSSATTPSSLPSSPARTTSPSSPIDDIFKSPTTSPSTSASPPRPKASSTRLHRKIMKPGIRIINCARGELIVEQALADALKSPATVAGAALDVFRQEPLKESPLLRPRQRPPQPPHRRRHRRSPGGHRHPARHAGSRLPQARRRAERRQPTLALARRVQGDRALHRDGQSASATSSRTPHPGNLETIQITYTGRIAAGKTDLIRNAAIAGIFSGTDGGSTANRINAAAIAAERGIRIQEDKKEFTTGGAGSVLKIVLHSSDGDASASATVLHGTSPRLLTYDGIDIEAPLHGTLVSIRNHDVPGVVGRIGTILGEHSVNIANFALGRAHSTQSHRVRRDKLSPLSRSMSPTPHPQLQPSRRCARWKPLQVFVLSNWASSNAPTDEALKSHRQASSRITLS